MEAGVPPVGPVSDRGPHRTRGCSVSISDGTVVEIETEEIEIREEKSTLDDDEGRRDHERSAPMARRQGRRKDRVSDVSLSREAGALRLLRADEDPTPAGAHLVVVDHHGVHRAHPRGRLFAMLEDLAAMG